MTAKKKSNTKKKPAKKKTARKTSKKAKAKKKTTKKTKAKAPDEDYSELTFKQQLKLLHKDSGEEIIIKAINLLVEEMPSKSYADLCLDEIKKRTNRNMPILRKIYNYKTKMLKREQQKAYEQQQEINRCENPPEISPLLFRKNFYGIVLKELELKVVRETDTCKAVILVGLGGMLTINAKPESKNLLVHDESGYGKDHICSSFYELLPEDRALYRKRISQTALTYWHNAENDPKWSWDNKLLYLEDVSNDVFNSDIFKVFSSSRGKAVSTITVKNKAEDFTIIGKPVMIITSASATPNPEQIRRWPITKLDGTVKQTEEICKRVAELNKVGKTLEYSPNVLLAISQLRPVKVRIPFADHLPQLFDMSNPIMRTHFPRVIDYIKFSASINQHSRPRDDEGFVIANGEDWENAREVIQKITSNPFSISLTKLQEKVLAVVKRRTIGILEGGVSASDIEGECTFCNQRTLYTTLDKLTDYKLLEKCIEKREDVFKPVFVYRLADVGEMKLPHFNQEWLNGDFHIATNTTSTTNTTIITNTTNTQEKASIPADQVNVVNVPIVVNASTNEKKNAVEKLPDGIINHEEEAFEVQNNDDKK